MEEDQWSLVSGGRSTRWGQKILLNCLRVAVNTECMLKWTMWPIALQRTISFTQAREKYCQHNVDRMTVVLSTPKYS